MNSIYKTINLILQYFLTPLNRLLREYTAIIAKVIHVVFHHVKCLSMATRTFNKSRIEFCKIYEIRTVFFLVGSLSCLHLKSYSIQ